MKHLLAPALALFTLMTASAADRELKVGEALPDLRLPLASDGSLLSTSDLRGQRTVFHIFAGW